MNQCSSLTHTVCNHLCSRGLGQALPTSALLSAENTASLIGIDRPPCVGMAAPVQIDHARPQQFHVAKVLLGKNREKEEREKTREKKEATKER